MQTFAGERFDSPKTGTHLVERAADVQWIVHPGGSDEQHPRSSSAHRAAKAWNDFNKTVADKHTGFDHRSPGA
jgi:hypothetical protein